MTTKTLLVSLNPKNPDSRTTDFLAVRVEATTPVFVGIKSKQEFAFGLVVYVGRQVSASDLIAKLADSGHRIENLPRAVQTLERYIERLQTFRIGNIVTIEPDDSGGFNLVKVANTPPTPRSPNLP